MIKKKWGDLLEAFKEGTVKLVTRKLSSREAEKCERLLDEQRRLADNLARAFTLFDTKLHKISSYIERCMEGETERLEPYVKNLQQDLAAAIARADLAVSDLAELESELADWQRNPTSNADSGNLRLNSLKAELSTRRPLQQDDPLVVEVQHSAPHANEADESGEVKKHGSVAYVEIRSVDMESDAESLVQHIQDLSRELGRYQHAPNADPQESLRMASQIKNLHAILRRADKNSGSNRDRIAATDGFRHVFNH